MQYLPSSASTNAVFIFSNVRFCPNSVGINRTNSRTKGKEKGTSALWKSLFTCVYVLFSVVFQYLAGHQAYAFAYAVELAESLNRRSALAGYARKSFSGSHFVEAHSRLV